MGIGHSHGCWHLTDPLSQPLKIERDIGYRQFPVIEVSGRSTVLHNGGFNGLVHYKHYKQYLVNRKSEFRGTEAQTAPRHGDDDVHGAPRQQGKQSGVHRSRVY